jgi:hypothetical protein
MAGHTTSDYTDLNNILAGTAGTLDAIREPNGRFDFGIKWVGDDRAVSIPGSPNQPSVGLIQGTFPMNPDFGAQAYRNGNSWDFGFAALSIDWVAGTLTGTIKENYYVGNFDSLGFITSRSLVQTRDNIDPGYGAIGSGRIGREYSFLATGSEYRIYNSREPDPVVVLAPSYKSPQFPLSLGGWVSGGSLNITNIRFVKNRSTQLSTVYSSRDRTADGISSGLHIRIYENPKPPLTVRGVPTDVNIT